MSSEEKTYLWPQIKSPAFPTQCFYPTNKSTNRNLLSLHDVLHCWETVTPGTGSSKCATDCHVPHTIPQLLPHAWESLQSLSKAVCNQYWINFNELLWDLIDSSTHRAASGKPRDPKPNVRIFVLSWLGRWFRFIEGWGSGWSRLLEYKLLNWACKFCII